MPSMGPIPDVEAVPRKVGRKKDSAGAEILPPPAYEMHGTALKRRYQSSVDPEGCLFFIEADSVSLIRRIVEVLLLQVNEINFEIQEDSIQIVGMESSQIALMDINVSKRNFSTWKINRPASVGISLNMLRDMLKVGGVDDFWRLYQFPNDEYVHMQMFSKKFQTVKLNFSWKTLDIEADAIEAPDYLCSGEPNIVLPSSRFREMMGEFRSLSEQVEMNLNPGHLTWHVTETNRVLDCWVDNRIDEEPGFPTRVEINCGQFRGWKKCFGLKHLDIFSRGATLASRIKIWIHDKHPACFHYDIENEPDLGWARFWLAPFVDNPAA